MTAPLSGKGRVLIAVDQAPRDASGDRTNDPTLWACIPVDDLLAKLTDMEIRVGSGSLYDEGYTGAWRELRDWIKEAR